MTYSKVAYWSSMSPEQRKEAKEAKELAEWKKKIRSMKFSNTDELSVEDYKKKLKETLKS